MNKFILPIIAIISILFLGTVAFAQPIPIIPILSSNIPDNPEPDSTYIIRATNCSRAAYIQCDYGTNEFTNCPTSPLVIGPGEPNPDTDGDGCVRIDDNNMYCNVKMPSSGAVRFRANCATTQSYIPGSVSTATKQYTVSSSNQTDDNETPDQNTDDSSGNTDNTDTTSTTVEEFDGSLCFEDEKVEPDEETKKILEDAGLNSDEFYNGCRFYVDAFASDRKVPFYFVLEKSKDYRLELSPDLKDDGTENDDFLMQANINDLNNEDKDFLPAGENGTCNLSNFTADGPNQNADSTKAEIAVNEDMIVNCHAYDIKTDPGLYLFTAELIINAGYIKTGDNGDDYEYYDKGLKEAWDNPNCKLRLNGDCPGDYPSDEYAGDDDVKTFTDDRDSRSKDKNGNPIPFDITGEYDLKLKPGETGSKAISIYNIAIEKKLPAGPCARGKNPVNGQEGVWDTIQDQYYGSVICSQVYSALGPINTDPNEFIGFLLSFLLSISGIILLYVLVSSGYKIMTSRDNPEAVQEARESITSAIVGLLFIIFSLVIIQVIGVDILHLPGFGE